MERALVWSYGGGTQSIALALLIAAGRLPRPERIIMADTGREASETWEYTAQYVAPLLATLGLTIEMAGHDLATVDLYSHKGDLLMPAFTGHGGQLSLFCSKEWKARVVQRYLRALGYGPARPVTMWMGMSLDEIGRLRPGDYDWQDKAYPLVFDVPMTRGECRQLIRDYGWPDPPKSSCWMCPYRRNSQWARLRDAYPADWAAAVAMDTAIRERDAAHDVYLHHSGQPLATADLSVPDEPELPLFGQVTGCDSGYCMV